MNKDQMARKLHITLNGIDEKQLSRFKSLYKENKNEMFSQILKEDNWREIFLDLYINLAVDTYTRYKLLNIDEKVFFDTMSDITIWAQNCQKKSGINGIEEYKWVEKSLDLKLFRLGRLQFEPIALDKEITLEEEKIEAGTIVYNVHIAEGEKLQYEEVQTSYREAMCFFRGISDIFICDSWLLSPVLSQLLGESSNIYQFQQDYEILFIDENSRQFEERVFGTVNENIRDYPEHTSLQRAGKSYLIKGGKIGKAAGAFKFILK